jgi:BirA family biotin operon repressor/biotin-[acetyl-CoA-carboxylase] ligase
MPDFLARQERFAVVDSTNDVVRGWLADGTPEVCLAVADEQTAGRGRAGRTWVAPPGGALLLSLGFRPDWLAPEHVWRLAATVSLAMAEAAEAAADLPAGTIRLKWPNDLVIETNGAAVAPDAIEVRKLAGVLGETEGLGSAGPRAVVGIGIDTDWAASDFPPELATTMTALRAASGGRRNEHEALLAGCLTRLEPRVEALRGGRFDVADWNDRQLTNGRVVEFVTADGETRLVRSLGVDVRSGALIVDDPDDPSGERSWLVGEIGHVRLAGAPVAVPDGAPDLVEV